MASEELKAMLRRWLADERADERPICTYVSSFEETRYKLLGELEKLFEADGLNSYLPFNKGGTDLAIERQTKAIKLNERRMAWVKKTLDNS